MVGILEGGISLGLLNHTVSKDFFFCCPSLFVFVLSFLEPGAEQILLTGWAMASLLRDS